MSTDANLRTARSLTSALVAALLAACGTGTPPPPAGNVGPAGATVRSADGHAVLVVPKGAVSKSITVALAAATDGFAADPLLVPGTVYELNAPETALAAEAELSIAVPASALLVGKRAASNRLHAVASPHLVVEPKGLLGCQNEAIHAGDVAPAGTMCTWNGSDWPQCPPGWLEVYHVNLYGFSQVLCAAGSAPPTPQFAQLGAGVAAVVVPSTFDPTTLTATAKLAALRRGLFGLLVDKVRPVVTLTAAVTPLGSGQGTVRLTATATDNVVVNRIELQMVDLTLGSGPFAPVSLKTTHLAQFPGLPGVGVWDSPSMALTDLYKEGRSYTASAVDAAGNLGVASASLTLVPPAITGFSAVPTTVPYGGGNVTLSWTLAPDPGTEVSTLVIDHGVGDVSGHSSKVVNVTAPTTFTLTATNLSGHAAATTTVAVAPQPPPVITSFTAAPATLPSGGGAVTLSWATSGAASVSIDGGVGAVTGTSKVINVAASTTFTLTATNPSGNATAQASVAVAMTDDRYVDPVAGADTSACTQAAPCKTILHAMSGAPANSAVYLYDGNYPSSAVTIPDGVALRALHPGAATLTFVSLTAAGSASLNGVVFDQQGSSCSNLTATSSAGTKALTLTGVLFKCTAVLTLGGTVKAVMTPGLLAGGLYTSLTTAYGSFLSLSGTAELLIEGGVFDFNNFGQGQYGPGMLNTTGSSKLTLDGVTLRKLKQQAFVIASGATVVLRNGTVLDQVGDGGLCVPGAAIVVVAGGTLSMDHAQITNGPNAGICVGGSQAPPAVVQLTQVTISGMANAVASDTGVSADAILTADGVALTGNARGIFWASASAASLLDLRNMTITGNSLVGVQIAGNGGTLKLRGSTVSNNGAEGGVTIYSTTVADLGTQASPGQNTFTGNAGPGVFSIVPTGATVDAVGNTWIPSQEGADASGRYSMAPDFTPVAKTGPVNGGVNYRIYNASTLNL